MQSTTFFWWANVKIGNELCVTTWIKCPLSRHRKNLSLWKMKNFIFLFKPSPLSHALKWPIPSLFYPASFVFLLLHIPFRIDNSTQNDRTDYWIAIVNNIQTSALISTAPHTKRRREETKRTRIEDAISKCSHLQFNDTNLPWAMFCALSNPNTTTENGHAHWLSQIRQVLII